MSGKLRCLTFFAVLTVASGVNSSYADYAANVLADNPIAYYRFDGDTISEGQTVTDETGNNDGVYVRTQAPTSKVTGPLLPGMTGNQAYSVAGVSNAPYANIGMLPGFGSSIVSGATVEFWVNSTGYLNRYVAGTYSDSSNNWFFAADRDPVHGMAADDHIWNYASWSVGGTQYDSNITDGSWNYVAIVMNYGAVEASERLKIYMADEGETSVTQLTGLTQPNQTENDGDFESDVLIGSITVNGVASSFGFEGWIDEFAFYDSALTEEQLNRHFSLLPPEDADFDSDQDVDLADLMIWQRGVGVGSTNPDGDADFDYDVDSDDLAIWQNQFGTGSSATLIGVPEPSGALLVSTSCMALTGLGGLRPRRRR